MIKRGKNLSGFINEAANAVIQGTIFSKRGFGKKLTDFIRSIGASLSIGNDGKPSVDMIYHDRIQVFKEYETLSNPKAIIVAGGGPFPGNTLWDATQATTNFAYRTLLYRGFEKEDILYLSSDTDLDFECDGVADVYGVIDDNRYE